MTHSDPSPGDVRPAIPVAPQYQAPVQEAVDRPASLTRAVQLMYVGAALSVVGIVVAWATKSQLRDKVATASPTLTSDQVDTALTVALVFATVVGLVGVGLWLWMAAANGAGRSWARIVSTVLGGLSLISALVGLSNSTGLTTALQLVSVVLAVVIIVLLWRPASSAYYRARSARDV